MKLKNRKTGEIVDLVEGFIKDVGGTKIVLAPVAIGYEVYEYTSLADLSAEWEDVPEEPKGIIKVEKSIVPTCVHIEYATEEEAEKAVEKLKAFTRLKDKGFRFVGWKNGKLEYPDYVSFDCEDYKGCAKDLDIVFGGEE